MPLRIRTAAEYSKWARTPARLRSREVDYGVHWTLGAQEHPQWRVSWIEATGELYARELGGAERFAVLGKFRTRHDVDVCMAGWAESLAPKSLGWIVLQIGAA